MNTAFTKMLFVITQLLLLASCATNSASSSANKLERHVEYSTTKDVQIVATDLVSALLQIPGYDSWSMTLQVSPAPLPFGHAVTQALKDAGYGIQKVKQDQGQNYISYQKRDSATDRGRFTTFLISVRGIAVSRNYRYHSNRWIPTSPIKIKGAKPTKVVVFDDLHFQDGKINEFISGVEFVDDQGNAVHSTERVVSIKESSRRVTGERINEARFLIMSKVNLFTKQRAVDNLKIRNYTPISKVTLTFPSQDPTVLGKGNKNAIAKLVSLKRSETDGFIIRGCSHGKSLIWDGTESDSLERQIRVNQELLVSGVSHEIIREEGCFADVNEAPPPRQSVFLTLRRETKTL